MPNLTLTPTLTATWALAEIGPAAVPALTQLLKGELGCPVRRCYGSGRHWSRGEDSHPGSHGIAKDKEVAVRQEAAWALGGIGSRAKTAIPALTELLKDKEGAVRQAAAHALGDIGPEPKQPFQPSWNY